MNKIEEENKPAFIFNNKMNPDKDYIKWIGDVKQRFRSAQIKAALKVNTELLEFYWSIGRDLVAMRAEEKWGSGIVKQFSIDMRYAFPNETGFSHSNVKYMKQWYSFYQKHCISNVSTVISSDNQKSQQVVDQFKMPKEFGLIPWGHHIKIFTKCKTTEEAFFYINQTIERNWSRGMLEEYISSNLYERQGFAVTNFSTQLPEPQGKLAQEILKDPFNFDFLTMKKGYEEKDLEDALISNITRFLLELGQGFAFVGRQMELRIPDGTSFYPDLVFYHTKLKSYVIIELKTVAFKPEFAGKMNFYLTATDELLRDDNDSQSIGIIICKSSSKTVVEWSLRGLERPLGVASYQLQEVVDRTVAELEMRNKNF